MGKIWAAKSKTQGSMAYEGTEEVLVTEEARASLATLKATILATTQDTKVTLAAQNAAVVNVGHAARGSQEAGDMSERDKSAVMCSSADC
ncbi:hypothetical protein NDU88_004346 [Pleurodeles waltl]|uniref:Uncharacterized protein n=1 Tax=Pleurodeles waltl TaxID=8319 RepID=A0AAV7RFG3_PLEWA|nr:hypothetical protein NDU88_004346 [Pleurodeles waltl]